jgi:putative acetyltransferase
MTESNPPRQLDDDGNSVGRGGKPLAARSRVAAGSIGCRRFERGDGTVEVKRMIVDQGTRGRGVGAALLWNAHAQARRLGAHTALLEVGVRNTEAQALYWRAGYRPCEPFPPYEQSPISLFMELRL